MSVLACLMAASVSLPSIFAADTARELRYSGTISQLSRQGASAPVKQFDLYVLDRSGGTTHRLFHLVNERGGDGWAWPERYGQLTLDAKGRRTEGRPAHVLHTHEGTKYPVELPQAVFENASRLAAGATWTSGPLAYEVRGTKDVGNRICWQVEAKDNFGRRQSFLVDQKEQILVGAERRVFMGRGDEFVLKVDLTGAAPLTEAATRETGAAVDAVLELQAKLQRAEGETKPELSDAQLAVVQTALPDLTPRAEPTALKSLVVAMSRDVQAQAQRAGDVASLAKKIVGQPAPEYTLSTLTGETIDSKKRAGRITVLHFWEYLGDPLEEPYGQVGYLDFINNRRGKAGVDVIGVAVNADFANQAKAGAATRSVRKLRDFMNLGYPLAIDAGGTLEKFGDPRPLGAKLPVWVVIGADGKIAHYYAGFYQIKPDEGLRELDNVLIRLIRAGQSDAK